MCRNFFRYYHRWLMYTQIYAHCQNVGRLRIQGHFIAIFHHSTATSAWVKVSLWTSIYICSFKQAVVFGIYTVYVFCSDFNATIFIRTKLVNVLLNCHNICVHTKVRQGNNLQYHLSKHLCWVPPSQLCLYTKVWGIVMLNIGVYTVLYIWLWGIKTLHNFIT